VASIPGLGFELTTEPWHDFLADFVDDPDLAARFKAQAPR